MNVLSETAAALVAPGKGILAADESSTTMSRRLTAAGVVPTARSRRDYRELLVTTPGLVDGISGVILCEETFGQRLSDGRTFPDALAAMGIAPGVKVDTGVRPLPGHADEKITEGLEGLFPRLVEFRELGARFAKWRAVLTIAEGRPSEPVVHANAHALARYASACQHAGLVPIVEPEVLMDGDHSLARCAEVTDRVLRAVFAELARFDVDRTAMVLKPNMVVPGAARVVEAPEAVAAATVEVLTGAVPADTSGIAFLSGGQPPKRATANLGALRRLATPWPLTFSFGRALVDPALAAWRGDPERVGPGQAALAERVRANSGQLQIVT